MAATRLGMSKDSEDVSLTARGGEPRTAQMRSSVQEDSDKAVTTGRMPLTSERSVSQVEGSGNVKGEMSSAARGSAESDRPEKGSPARRRPSSGSEDRPSMLQREDAEKFSEPELLCVLSLQHGQPVLAARRRSSSALATPFRADPTPQSPVRRTSVPLHFLSPPLGSLTSPKSRAYALSQPYRSHLVRSNASVQSWVLPLLQSEAHPRCLCSCPTWLRPSHFPFPTFSWLMPPDLQLSFFSDFSVSGRRLAFLSAIHQSLEGDSLFFQRFISVSRRRLAFL